MSQKLTDQEKARVLRILRNYFPNGYDDHGQQEENDLLALKVAQSFADSDRLDYIEKQAHLSYTGLSINGHPNKTTEIMWRLQRFEPQPNLRLAVDLAIETFPEGQARPAPPGTRVVIGKDQMVRCESGYGPADLLQVCGEIKRVDPTPQYKPPKSMYQRTKKFDFGDPVLNKIMGFIYEQGSFSPGNRVGPEEDLVENGQLDSLDHIELMMTIEDEWGLQIPDETAAKLRTGNLIAAYVKRERQDDFA